jgi:hypothetical protein
LPHRDRERVFVRLLHLHRTERRAHELVLVPALARREVPAARALLRGVRAAFALSALAGAAFLTVVPVLPPFALPARSAHGLVDKEPREAVAVEAGPLPRRAYDVLALEPRVALAVVCGGTASCRVAVGWTRCARGQDMTCLLLVLTRGTGLAPRGHVQALSSLALHTGASACPLATHKHKVCCTRLARLTRAANHVIFDL